MPKVSIILPVYNVEKYLSHCLDSIVSQTFSDFELIAVSDSSPDRSIEILKDYAACDGRIKVFEKPHSGLGLTRNFGLEKATGEYVLFVDSDDYISRNALEVLVKKAEETKSDLVFFNLSFEDTKRAKSIICPIPYEFDTSDKALCEELFSAIVGISKDSSFNKTPMIGSACRRFAKRSLFTEGQIEFPNEQEVMLEDNVTAIQLHKKAEKILLIPDVLYHYRYNPKSLSASYRENKFLMFKNYYNLVSEILKENDCFEKEINKLDAWFVRFAAHESLVNIFSGRRNKTDRRSRYSEIKEILRDPYLVRISGKDFSEFFSKKDMFVFRLLKLKSTLLTFVIYRIYSLLLMLRRII